MEEKAIVVRQLKISIVIGIILLIVGIIIHNMTYLFGFMLGLIISLIEFRLVVLSCDLILDLSLSKFLVFVLFIVRYLLYGLGFVIAIKVPYFNIFLVLIGYLLTKIAIYYEQIITDKGGETSD